MNNDNAAINLWGEAYARIPKSVFAIVAWYLADICNDVGAGNGQAVARFIEELDALRSNGILNLDQVRRARAAADAIVDRSRAMKDKP
jgi:hypothetical protein